MSKRMAKHWVMGALLPAVALLGGCATAVSPVEVTRFHAPDPVARSGGFLIESMVPQASDSIEFRTYAAAVSQEMQRIGFTDEAGKQTLVPSEYVVRVDAQRSVQSPLVNRSPVSVGVGGSTGSYGSGVGLGIGIDLSGKPKNIVTTSLSVQIRKRADNSTIWEGRAMTQAKEGTPAAQPGLAAAKLASALYSDYPGKSGETITVK
ncbi:DUF4136 domain-containing protein [Sphingobium fluviale]